MSAVTPADLLPDPIASYPSATVACFDPTCGDLPRRALDEDKNGRFLRRLAESGAPAVLIAASTGHGHLRTVDELQQWLVSSAHVDLGDTVRMALLRPEDGIDANRRLIALLPELGYAVVFIRPGTDLPPGASDDQVADNMRPLVQAAADCGLAVGLYSIPDVSGLPLSPAAATQLVDGSGGDHIVAVKVTEADYQQSTLRFLQQASLAHLKIVQGWDPHLAQALQDGPKFDPQGRQRCGVTSGPMSLAVFQYLHMFEAVGREDWSEVAAAQQAVTTLFQSMQDDPEKFADLQRAKFIMGLGHPLKDTISPTQVERVLQALESLPRAEDRARLARSLDLLGDGPFHKRLEQLSAAG